MKLILMRHMKSGWDGMTSDHARPLSERGAEDAPRIGAWLQKQGTPDLALVSDSLRTRETFAGLGVEPPAHHSRALYQATAGALLTFIQARRGDAQTLLVVAHNPGIAELAAMLVADDQMPSAFYDYPPGATTLLEFADTIGPQQGHLRGFATPRTL
jgi:phosphohistidine phosphatase